MVDVTATIYSVLGIDWFVYVDPASSLGFLNVSEFSDLFG
jgi:hypothetical protein